LLFSVGELRDNFKTPICFPAVKLGLIPEKAAEKAVT
jgi:hypothetical protein